MTRRRGDRFIQLTELLYRVAEAADSESTHEALAAKVTRSTDWLVEAEDVRDLLRGRLISAKLVAPPGGGSHVSPFARDASPLRMNGRTRVLGPDGVDKIAKVFGVLFVSGVFHEFGHAAALRYGGIGPARWVSASASSTPRSTLTPPTATGSAGGPGYGPISAAPTYT